MRSSRQTLHFAKAIIYSHARHISSTKQIRDAQPLNSNLTHSIPISHRTTLCNKYKIVNCDTYLNQCRGQGRRMSSYKCSNFSQHSTRVQELRRESCALCRRQERTGGGGLAVRSVLRLSLMIIPCNTAHFSGSRGCTGSSWRPRRLAPAGLRLRLSSVCLQSFVQGAVFLHNLRLDLPAFIVYQYSLGYTPSFEAVSLYNLCTTVIAISYISSLNLHQHTIITSFFQCSLLPYTYSFASFEFQQYVVNIVTLRFIYYRQLF